MFKQIADWLESRWVNPAYSGWVLIGIICCFFGAAVNTMAGWLYVLSGLGLALLAVAAILPVRSLRGITVCRLPIQPVSAGEELALEIEIVNQSPQPKTLLQIQDLLPFVLGKPITAPIEIIPPQTTYRWIYQHLTQRRGVYRWQNVQLRTAAPIGLFWCRRNHELPATAIVYPIVLPLTHCPLIDAVGQADRTQTYAQQRVQLATEGLTRSLRPYRQGDALRLIHWRSSARYGELRVRELEVMTSGQELTICLDTAEIWEEDNFEQAVIAAASLYFYAQKQQFHAKIWTSATGLVQGDRSVLHTLAATHFGEDKLYTVPQNPTIWLTQNPQSFNALASQSRWLLWTSAATQSEILNRHHNGFIVEKHQALETQLQTLK